MAHIHWRREVLRSCNQMRQITFTETVYLNSNRRAIHQSHCSQIQSLWERNYVRHGLELSSNPNLLSCLYNGDRSRSAQNVAAGYTASASSVCFVSSSLQRLRPHCIPKSQTQYWRDKRFFTQSIFSVHVLLRSSHCPLVQSHVSISPRT